MLELYFDGSCLNNPNGAIGYGYHLNLNGVEIENGFDGKEAKTGHSNNVAEYMGLILGLEFCLDSDLKNQNLIVKGDSNMVIMQMSGAWRIKNGLYRQSALECLKLVGQIRKSNSIQFKWIPRDMNYRADELSNQYYYKP